MSQESFFFLCFLHSTVGQSFQGVMHLPRNNTLFYLSAFSWILLGDCAYSIKALD